MDDLKLELPYPPIVEAVLDIDCDVPATEDLTAFEAPALARLGEWYPKLTYQWLQEFQLEAGAEAEQRSPTSNRAVQALRFQQADGKQLVQVRAQGYSFNRLAPYTALDDYLNEIEKTWRIYVDVAHPTQVRQIRLRYINRILIPMQQPLDLDRYLKLGPRVPDEDKLTLTSFFNQFAAVELGTGLQVNTTLTVQLVEDGKLPVIFDNSVLSVAPELPENWDLLLGRIIALRGLKNRVFKNTLTDACLELFQRP